MTRETSAPHQLLDVAALEEALRQFAEKRDWERFHSPKNLAMALTGEVGELVELFQWLSEAESARIMEDPESAARVEHELADVMLYLIRLSSVLGVDMNAAVQRKLILNAGKYPEPDGTRPAAKGQD